LSQLALYAVGTGDSFPGGKAVGACSLDKDERYERLDLYHYVIPGLVLRYEQEFYTEDQRTKGRR